LSKIQDTVTLKTLNCTRGFYQENGSSVCIPSCHIWTENKPAASKAIDVILLFSHLVGFVTTIAVLIISVVKRKRM